MEEQPQSFIERICQFNDQIHLNFTHRLIVLSLTILTAIPAANYYDARHLSGSKVLNKGDSYEFGTGNLRLFVACSPSSRLSVPHREDTISDAQYYGDAHLLVIASYAPSTTLERSDARVIAFAGESDYGIFAEASLEIPQAAKKNDTEDYQTVDSVFGSVRCQT